MNVHLLSLYRTYERHSQEETGIQRLFPMCDLKAVILGSSVDLLQLDLFITKHSVKYVAGNGLAKADTNLYL